MSTPDERYREPPECWVCDGIGGQRDMLTGDWLECWRCDGLGVLPRQEPVKSAEPAAEMVDCPACGGEGRRIVYGYIGRDFMPRDPRIEDCSDCEGTGRVTAARAHDLRQEAAETAEAGADDRPRAWRERMQEGGL
jgi:DnaJ-class molecular chaperone